MSTRIIKKNTTRKLYDPIEHRHVSMEHVRRLVADRIDFAIVHSRTGEDFTCRALLRLVCEVEASNPSPVLSRQCLSELIRLQCSPSAARAYLDQCVMLFKEAQHELTARNAQFSVDARATPA